MIAGHLQPVVLGRGCLCSLGATYPACMELLFAPPGRWQSPQPASRLHTGHAHAFPVFELPHEVLAALPGGDGLTLTARLGLAAGLEALEEARLDGPDALRDARVGVCVGTTVGSTLNNEEFYRQYRDCPPEQPPDMEGIQRYLRSNPAEVLAAELRGRGAVTPCVQTVCNACSSGADALALGASWLKAGLCDLVLAGGADELCRVTLNGFISLMIHSKAPAAPFDAQRAGLNLGEGAAMLLMTAASTNPDAPSKGRLLAAGMRCDAYHLTAPHPEGRGLAAALEEALAQSSLAPQDVAFVNAHGTGTKDNDRVEAGVLARMLPAVPFFSIKGRTGHTLGAAGAIEAVLTLGCLEQQRIPPSAGCLTPDPELPTVPVLTGLACPGSAALSFSLAFGGGNAVLALGR